MRYNLRSTRKRIRKCRTARTRALILAKDRVTTDGTSYCGLIAVAIG